MQAAISEPYGMLSRFIPMMQERASAADVSADGVPFRVLIMEANVPLARLLATGLTAEQLSVEVPADIASALKRFESQPCELLILDLDIPEMDGLKLLRELRAKHPDVRILALSGRSETGDLVRALDGGADDYLPKPFSLLEMMARVRALRRRSLGTAAATAKVPSIVLNRDQCGVERDGRFIELTPREFTLLEYMMQNAGKTLSRAVLTQEVWNMPAEGNTNIVDVYIKYLRDKLDGDHPVKMIRTVRGMGYLYQVQAAL